MAEITLEVLHAGTVVFSSSGKWLHPLFELEEYLDRRDYAVEEITVRDKIVGRAAALLMARLGIRHVEAGILSGFAQSVLARHGIAYSYETLVPRILCKTEELLEGVDDLEEAYQLLAARAARSAR